MLNNHSQLNGEGQDSPTSTTGRVERTSHFRSGSSDGADLHDKGILRPSWVPSTEVRAHFPCRAREELRARHDALQSRAEYILLVVCAGGPEQGAWQPDVVCESPGPPAEWTGMQACRACS